jgi:hypothetical protein
VGDNSPSSDFDSNAVVNRNDVVASFKVKDSNARKKVFDTVAFKDG